MRDMITIVGNIAAAPEERRTHQGAVFAVFRVGSTERRYDAERQTWIDESTSWYRVQAFRALGEHILASFQKGDRVIVTGRLQIRDWESGDRRGTTAEVTAEAAGHDLRFGSTRFAASAARRSEPSPAVAEAPEEDAWAVPGADEPVPF